MSNEDRNPYAPPESVVERAADVAQSAGPPSRGILLTVLLVILSIANVTLTGFYFLALVGKIALPDRGAWAAPFLFLLAALNVACLMAMWRWRRWGIIGLANSAMFLCCLDLSRGRRLPDAALGVLGLVLLVVVASFKWKHFE